MMSYLWIFLLASLAIGANTQELDLSDALGLDDPATPAPVPKEPETPEKPSDGAGDLDLSEAVNPEPPKVDPQPTEKPKAPEGDDLDLGDALGPDPAPVPDKPADDPPKDGGNAGGSFGDTDLHDLVEGGTDDKPDGGRGGARAADPAGGSNGAGEGEPAEAGSGPLAGILSAVGVALFGAASSYYAYYKKKLCFKVQGGADPESANKDSGTQAEPQVMSNLLSSS
ncbi:hypothetical protein AGOR_G00060810 [Albula goreensis]|uniref:Uncharacterized protein n=1 Tax=Albula goreensis TaxID=1534307 RepID=A0A8T3DQ98_9TELE|nr:hypothetical protein AGOR_G00060810 [Albula goreensis]